MGRGKEGVEDISYAMTRDARAEVVNIKKLAAVRAVRSQVDAHQGMTSLQLAVAQPIVDYVAQYLF
jgi:hypothetical protein